MRFARLRVKGAEVPVVKSEDKYYDLRPLTDDLDGAFLARGITDIQQALTESKLRLLELDRVEYGPPIARPSAIICIGMNYAKHAEETGSPSPDEPIVFLKHPNTLQGPNDIVRLPPHAQEADWEVELGIVIKSRALYLESKERALECIAGYTLCNDLSERHYQMVKTGGQWSRGKCFPGFSPVGPYLVTPDEIDATNVGLWTRVNGKRVQTSSTSDMIFTPGEIVYKLSQHMALEPGDLIMTGTPEGVALSGNSRYLEPGDVVEMGLDGVGQARQQFMATSDV